MSGGTTDYPHWRPEFSLIAKADVGLGWMNPAADDFPPRSALERRSAPASSGKCWSTRPWDKFFDDWQERRAGRVA
jgi:hypothetical protein